MQRAGIFIPWPVIEPLALALEEWSLDCWTTREVPILSIFLYNSLLLIPPLHGQTNLWNVMQSKASQEGAFFLSSVTVTPSLPMILTDHDPLPSLGTIRTWLYPHQVPHEVILFKVLSASGTANKQGGLTLATWGPLGSVLFPDWGILFLSLAAFQGLHLP